MPIVQTIRLPSCLPRPGEQLQKILPPTHDSLGVILGLALEYLRHLHPAKLHQPDESMRASAHLLNLFTTHPLALALHPKSTPANTAPAKELNALQVRLTSLENTLVNLTKATSDVRKDLKTKPTPTASTAKPQASTGKAPATLITYAAKAAAPQCPSCYGSAGPSGVQGFDEAKSTRVLHRV